MKNLKIIDYKELNLKDCNIETILRKLKPSAVTLHIQKRQSKV